MRVDELLTEIEPMTYGERCRRLAELRDPAGLLEDLGGRGHYERSLALFIASAVRDAASLTHIAKAMRDPDAGLACGAIRQSARLGLGVETFAELLADAPAAVRAATYQAIRRWRRRDLAEGLIERTADRWGEAEAAALLPACGEDVARARLESLAHAVPNWRSVGRSHPGVVLDHADRQLADLPEAVLASWWTRHAAGVAAAVPYAPGRVVTLLQRYWRAGDLPLALSAKVGLLLDAEPDRTLRLVLADEHRAALRHLLQRRSVRDRLARLDDYRLAAVARAVRGDDGALGLLLKALAPSSREQMFDVVKAGVDLSTAELDGDLLDLLPQARRVREARRMLRLTRIAESPERTWETTAFLPYDEALPVLQEVARRPDAEERATGYALLVRCAGRSRDPEVLTRLLGSLDRVRNDQEPVRAAVLEALAQIPPGPLRTVHLPALTRLAEDALNARDSSWATHYTLSHLAAHVGRQGANRDETELVVFTLEVYKAIARHVGAVHLDRIDRVLRRGQERDLVRALAPQLAEAARRDDHRLVLGLASALHRRAYDLPELQDALEAALDAHDDDVLRQAIPLWLASPRTRAERVAGVVEKDPSAVAIPQVLQIIARERTDLLHLVLSGRTSTGRFRHPDVLYVPIAEPVWTLRWTGRQRTGYLALLQGLADDPGVPGDGRGRAVAAIGSLPGTDTGTLRPYLDSDDAYLRRAALTAAAWTASPREVLPLLLERASSDDAHVAVYAASRAARFVPPSALAASLGPVLAAGKITARKEALRMLLRNRVPGALDLIAAAWDEPGQHPDVRAAIVSAVRGHLGEPVALRILTAAADGPRDLARQVIGTPPLQVEDRFRAAYAGLVLRVARSADPEARDAALPSLPAWAPWAPDAPALLADLVGDLSRTSGWRTALDALVTCVMTGTGAAHLTSAATELNAAPALPDADAERDLPALQRFTALAETVRQRSVYERDAAEAAIRALDGHLPEPLGTELIAATLRWDAPDLAETLDALADRHPGGALAIDTVAQALATGPAGEVSDPWGYSPVFAGRPEPEQVHPHAARLAARGDLPGGLFACALTDHHGPRAGWPEEWRELLRGLRAHPHPDVAHAARKVFTADE